MGWDKKSWTCHLHKGFNAEGWYLKLSKLSSVIFRQINNELVRTRYELGLVSSFKFGATRKLCYELPSSNPFHLG